MFFPLQLSAGGTAPHVETIFQAIDVLVVPSAPRPMTVAEVAADPIGRNVQLGTYSYFVNPLDLCAIAVPAGSADGGVPFGVTFVGPAFADMRLAGIAAGVRAWVRRACTTSRRLHFVSRHSARPRMSMMASASTCAAGTAFAVWMYSLTGGQPSSPGPRSPTDAGVRERIVSEEAFLR